MQIKSLEIKNIRNIEKKKIKFNKTNLIIGKNGTGKTTIAECIYFCCFYKSFKTNKIKDLIKFNLESGNIILEYEKDNQLNTIKINFYNNQKKFFLNDKEVDDIYDIINQIKCILITPNNIDLINDNPSKRRKYLNIILSQNDINYLKNLVTYNKLIKIKNKILKEYQKNGKINEAYLQIINSQIEEIDSWIIEKRILLLKKIEIAMNEILKKISKGTESIKLTYTNVQNNSNKEELYYKELKYYKTLKGNHLDDFEFSLNSKNAKIFASQGQKRLLTLCFFLSQKKLDKKDELKDEYLLIFDDVSIDLDKDRQIRLLNYLKNQNQTIYISTDIIRPLLKKNKNINIINMP